jgi:hypothetical protein
MRTLAAFAVLATCLAFTHDARAQGTYYPWCARYDAFAYNCGFVTRAQCQLTVSGGGGICYENPMPAPVGPPRASQKRKYKRSD